MSSESEIFNRHIMDHFLNPRNIGEIADADGYARIGDPSCGDFIVVWIRVKDQKIDDFKFKVFGCWGAISTTSVVSELAIGKSISEAIKLSDDDVIKELGGIPENKQHCSMLGIHGLRAAVADYVLKDNHRSYSARIELYRSNGYDIPQMRDQIVQRLADLPNTSKILDVGCGKGHLSLAIARAGRRCTTVDISPEEMHIARLNAIYHKFDDQIDFQLQDARELKFDSHTFDAVLSASVFHHIIHPERVLDQMLRVCRAGGRIIIADLNDAGKELVARVRREAGSEHLILGWSIEEVYQWFAANKYRPSMITNEYENMIDVVNAKN